MPGFNTIPGSSGGGGAGALNYVASVHMSTYNRSWAQAGTAGNYGIYSQNQENGYAYFVGTGTTTGVSLNRMINVSHAFTRIDIIAPQNDIISLYKVKVKATTEFTNPFAGFVSSSYPTLIQSSGNFILPNAALPLVNVAIVGGGGGGGMSHSGHGGGGGGGGGNVVKLTAISAVGATGVTIGGSGGGGDTGSAGGTTYFGNVYALGGGGGGSHGSKGTTAVHGNGGGKGGAYSYETGSSGTVQTVSTGLGTSGSPTAHGGHAGGGAGVGSHNNNRGGGGGGGSTGVGGEGGAGYAGAGGAGHVSDIWTGSSNTKFGPGGRSAAPDGTLGSDPMSGFTNFGHGGTTNHSTSTQVNGNGGGVGTVVVRYYIP
jgi:hypothetical protein